MNKLTISWVVLMVLTLASGFASVLMENSMSIFILIFATIKFVIVSFCYMHLIKAHDFWKITTTLFMSILMIIIFCVLLVEN